MLHVGVRFTIRVLLVSPTFVFAHKSVKECFFSGRCANPPINGVCSRDRGWRQKSAVVFPWLWLLDNV
jgi:hypothetical protein